MEVECEEARDLHRRRSVVSWLDRTSLIAAGDVARSMLDLAPNMATSQSNAVVQPATDCSIQPGSLISAYRIEALVGRGGMGWVYRARHVVTSLEVAIKILREDQVEHERAVDRMMREASILASVAHPGIPRFYECGLLPDRRVWIAMELVEGISLAERLQHGPLCP